MPAEGPQELHCGSVPDLHSPRHGAHREFRTVLVPRDGAYRPAKLQITELCDNGGAGRPEIDTRPQTNRNHVFGGPVEEIEIEVILQTGRVEHLERSASNLALCARRGDCGRRKQSTAGVGGAKAKRWCGGVDTGRERGGPCAGRRGGKAEQIRSCRGVVGGSRVALGVMDDARRVWGETGRGSLGRGVGVVQREGGGSGRVGGVGGGRRGVEQLGLEDGRVARVGGVGRGRRGGQVLGGAQQREGGVEVAGGGAVRDEAVVVAGGGAAGARGRADGAAREHGGGVGGASGRGCCVRGEGEKTGERG